MEYYCQVAVAKKKILILTYQILKYQKKNSEKILNSENPESLVTKKEIIINELKNYQNKSEILGAVKFGKKEVSTNKGLCERCLLVINKNK